MAITESQFKKMSPGRNVVIDGRGRRWHVISHLLKPQYGSATFVLDLEYQGDPTRYSFVPGTGIVDEEYGVDVDLNHPDAYII